MAIPEYIRKVPRPANTVVVDNGKDGPNRYAVRERAGTKYIRDGNPQPKNGKVIGHIFDGAYIPLNGKTAASRPDMLSYGAAAFARSVSADILTDLLGVYPAKDACVVMAIATLRIIHPSITADRMGTHYRRTFVCQHYPGGIIRKHYLHLSAETRAGRRQAQNFLPEACCRYHCQPPYRH